MVYVILYGYVFYMLCVFIYIDVYTSTQGPWRNYHLWILSVSFFL